MSFSLSIILVTIILMVISYIVGSVNFAIIYTNHFAHTDVRQHGSGNAGMTNVLRTAGKAPAILTLLCDFSKGAAAVLLGRFGAYYLLSAISKGATAEKIDPLYFAYIAGFFCLMGHIYPLFFSFRGGKGVASLAGIMLMIDWKVMLIAVSIFLVMLLLTKIVSISSVIASATLPFLTYFLYVENITYSYTLLGLNQRTVITIFSAFFTLIILIKHIPNLKRIAKGEEKKISQKKK